MLRKRVKPCAYLSALKGNYINKKIIESKVMVIISTIMHIEERCLQAACIYLFCLLALCTEV